MKRCNFILNSDRTRKNIISVDEATARSADCPIDIGPEDIFVENAPPLPDGMIRPKLSTDNTVWIESAPQSEIDAIQAEQALSQCIAQRKARYKEESDPLYLDTMYDAEKSGVKPDLTAWVALKDRIKLEIPKP